MPIVVRGLDIKYECTSCLNRGRWLAVRVIMLFFAGCFFLAANAEHDGVEGGTGLVIAIIGGMITSGRT